MAGTGAISIWGDLVLNVSGPDDIVYSIENYIREAISAVSSLSNCTTFIETISINVYCDGAGGGINPPVPCQQDAEAMVEADFEAYCDSWAPDTNFENYDVPEAAKPQVDVYKWTISQEKEIDAGTSGIFY